MPVILLNVKKANTIRQPAQQNVQKEKVKNATWQKAMVQLRTKAKFNEVKSNDNIFMIPDA
jgi:hypothetical protein